MDYNYFHSKINQLQDLKDASDVKSESIDLAVRLDDLKSLSKKLYDAKKMMISMGKEIGLEFIDSTSENLKKTTRMFNPNFTNALKFEHVMVFKNVKNDL